jgi:peptidoglycan hydrolase CwlO-like protein
MGARRPWTRLAALGGLALVALVSSSAARADDPATLRSEIERLRAESDGLAARSQEALLELYALETRLARAQGRLAALDARREALEREEAAARRTLELARADVEEAERQLSDHLRELYVQDEVDPLAVILGAESLDEALSAFDGLTRLADLDRSILEDVRAARLEVQKALRALAERSAELRDVVARVEAEQAKLLDARSEREAFIAELAAQRAGIGGSGGIGGVGGAGLDSQPWLDPGTATRAARSQARRGADGGRSNRILPPRDNGKRTADGLGHGGGRH